jgi:hypothetical protein
LQYLLVVNETLGKEGDLTRVDVIYNGATTVLLYKSRAEVVAGYDKELKFMVSFFIKHILKVYACIIPVLWPWDAHEAG